MIVVTIKKAMFEIGTDKILFEDVNGVSHGFIEGDKGIWDFPASDIVKIEEKPSTYILQKML